MFVGRSCCEFVQWITLCSITPASGHFSGLEVLYLRKRRALHWLGSAVSCVAHVQSCRYKTQHVVVRHEPLRTCCGCRFCAVPVKRCLVGSWWDWGMFAASIASYSGVLHVLSSLFHQISYAMAMSGGLVGSLYAWFAWALLNAPSWVGKARRMI